MTTQKIYLVISKLPLSEQPSIFILEEKLSLPSEISIVSSVNVFYLCKLCGNLNTNFLCDFKKLLIVAYMKTSVIFSSCHFVLSE